MHRYVIKCQPTERPEAFYYGGLVDEKQIIWVSSALEACPFNTRADAIKVGQELKLCRMIVNCRVELIDTDEPVMPKLGYEETEKLKAVKPKNPDKGLWVIKYSNGQYSCGLKKFSSQLREAQIYVSKKRAEEQALHYIKGRDCYTGKMIAPTEEFKIVPIMIKELEEV